MIRFCITPTLFERERKREREKNSNCELTHLPSFPLFPSQHETHKQPEEKCHHQNVVVYRCVHPFHDPPIQSFSFLLLITIIITQCEQKRNFFLLVMAFRLDGMDVCQKSITRHLRRYQPNDIGKQAYNFPNLSFIYTSVIIIISLSRLRRRQNLQIIKHYWLLLFLSFISPYTHQRTLTHGSHASIPSDCLFSLSLSLS